MPVSTKSCRSTVPVAAAEKQANRWCRLLMVDCTILAARVFQSAAKVFRKPNNSFHATAYSAGKKSWAQPTLLVFTAVLAI